MKIVAEETLRELVGEEEALTAVEGAFAALSRGQVIQPPPFGMDLPAHRGEVHGKGAYVEGDPIFAIKVASGFYDNAERGLPTGSGLVLVFDAETGFPLALLQDNGYLTELRTAAAGALAVSLLTPDDPLTVGVIGAGSQARYQLTAIARVRTLEEVRVWSPDDRELPAYRDEMEPAVGVPVRGVGAIREAVEGSHLVVTVTPSRKPLVQADWLSQDATVVAVGSDGPEKQELEARVLRRARKIVVDSMDQCSRLGETHHALEAGLLTREEIHGELGEIVLDRKAGREGSELIVCDLTGVGAQDAAIAGAAWKALRHQAP